MCGSVCVGSVGVARSLICDFNLNYNRNALTAQIICPASGSPPVAYQTPWWRVGLGTFLGLPLSHTNSCGRIRWGGRHGWGAEGFEPLNRTAALSGPMRRFTEA